MRVILLELDPLHVQLPTILQIHHQYNNQLQVYMLFLLVLLYLMHQ